MPAFSQQELGNPSDQLNTSTEPIDDHRHVRKDQNLTENDVHQLPEVMEGEYASGNSVRNTTTTLSSSKEVSPTASAIFLSPQNSANANLIIPDEMEHNYQQPTATGLDIMQDNQNISRVNVDLTLDDNDDDDESVHNESYLQEGSAQKMFYPRIKSEFPNQVNPNTGENNLTTKHPGWSSYCGSSDLEGGVTLNGSTSRPFYDNTPHVDDLSQEALARLRKEYQNYSKQYVDLLTKPNSDEEDIRMRAACQQVKDNYEKRQQDSLFVPEHRDRSPTYRNDTEIFNDFTLSGDPITHSPTPEPHLGLGRSAEKRAGRGRPKGAKAIPKPTTKAGVKKRKTPTALPKAGRSITRSTHDNIGTLLNNDIIGAANANQGQAAQPGFTSTNKKNALAQLIDSIPLEERNLYIGDKVDLQKASENFSGRGAMKADGRDGWLLRGMNTSLRHYQMLGVSWMRSREKQARNPRGGILSDDMGLGKTVSALANLVDGRACATHTGPKATLIVVPPALMNQWLEEIEKHVKEPGKVMVWRSKMKVIDPATYLACQDIVITSYHEVVRSLPSNDPPPHLFTAKAKAEWWEAELEIHRGPLHRVNWNRIILDEAQAIKNHLSKTSEAICHLRGRNHWCLSGTPIQNGLEEFYPYFKFLRCENTGSFELFKRNFTKRGSDKAIQRLQVYLTKIMLRRTHLDQLFGRPILQLPPIKPVETIEVKFNIVERSIYRIVERRFVEKIKTLSEGDHPENNYQQFLVLLLRLRQLVGHPLLIQKTLKDILELQDLELLHSVSDGKIGEDDSDRDCDPTGNHETALALRETLNRRLSTDATSYPGSTRLPARDNQLSLAFRQCLDALREDGHWEKANLRSICAACSSPPSNPYITSCHHIYCSSCLSELQYSESKANKQSVTCLECGSSIHKGEAYIAIPSEEIARGSGRQTPEEDIDWYALNGPILRSAKVKGAVAQIKKWFDQDKSNKIIVFTQFRGMIRVMARVCEEERGWGYATYHGSMPFELRDEQIRRFSKEEDCRILLAGIKAGGVGLNLTAANRVIILDLWWNMSVESQAFTRCFRIGQTRDVEVVRFVVHDSIDGRIQALQQKKLTEINQAMEQRHRSNLTTKELMQLFSCGPDEEDEEGGDDTQTNRGEDENFVLTNDPYDPVDIEDDKEDDLITME